MLDAEPLSNPTLSGKTESLHREIQGVFLVFQEPKSCRPLAPSVVFLIRVTVGRRGVPSVCGFV